MTAIISSRLGADTRTYTIGFAEAAYDESQWAKAVAAHLGTHHTSERLTMDEAERAGDTAEADRIRQELEHLEEWVKKTYKPKGGHTSPGRRVTLDNTGKKAGVFTSREAALRFARLESPDEHFAVVHVNERLEFDYAA